MLIETDVPRARSGLAARGLLLLAVAAAGCTGGDSGTVAASPKSSPDTIEAVPSKKGSPAPRVPRGPDAAKALQEAKGK